MKKLEDFKHQINSCSKCGLCQAQCPVYKITGNDCTVSRGHFTMLQGFIKGDLKMSKTINRYLDLCLKCDKCSSFCPSGIDVVDVIFSAKAEYFNSNPIERFISSIQKNIIFGAIPNILNLLSPKSKSKTFDKKVLFFGGCGAKLTGNASVVKILNSLNIEAITPNFDCCGITLLTRGDLKGVNSSIDNYINLVKKYDIKEIVTTCASCEKWTNSEETKEFLKTLKIKNIYEYIRENNLELELKKKEIVTYHKPCNISNFNNIEWILNNTTNLEYKPLENIDECCGLNGLSKISEYQIMKNIFSKKRTSIKNTQAKIVLTSCLGCEIALKTYALNNYKVFDLSDFIAKRVRNR